jgi:hypothetical protein
MLPVTDLFPGRALLADEAPQEKTGAPWDMFLTGLLIMGIGVGLMYFARLHDRYYLATRGVDTTARLIRMGEEVHTGTTSSFWSSTHWHVVAAFALVSGGEHVFTFCTSEDVFQRLRSGDLTELHVRYDAKDLDRASLEGEYDSSIAGAIFGFLVFLLGAWGLYGQITE